MRAEPAQLERRLRRRWCGAACTVALIGQTGSLNTAQAEEPPVPPGRHPGGVAVAVVGPQGIDYTIASIAARLARDGEGELIGWDFIDHDRLPYQPLAPATPDSMTRLASVILREAGASCLIPIRTPPQSDAATVRPLVLLAQTPARVALYLDAGARARDWRQFAEAGAHFNRLLLVVPVAAGANRFPAALGLANMMVVAAAAEAGGRAGTSTGQVAVELTVGVDALPASRSLGAMAGAVHKLAAARVAALAARLLKHQPELTGAALKRRILGLGRAVSGHSHRYLAAPDRATRSSRLKSEPQSRFRFNAQR